MKSIESREEVYKPGDEVPIEIDELIFPFAHPANYKQSWYQKGENETCLKLNIKLPNFTPVKLSTRVALAMRERNGVEIVPLNPENGYIITQEDLDINKRREKLIKNIIKNGGFGIDQRFPLFLDIGIAADKFIEDGFAMSENNFDEFMQTEQISYKPHVPVIFSFLKCRVYAGNMSFEAYPYPLPQRTRTSNFRDNFDILDYDLLFSGFYPLDTGPLALENSYDTSALEDDGSDLEIGPGHELIFSDDKNEQSKIAMEFTLNSNLPG